MPTPGRGWRLGGPPHGGADQEMMKNALCGNLETDSHLFFSCDFATAVWFAGTPSIRTDLLPQGPQGVQQELSSLITPYYLYAGSLEAYHHYVFPLEGSE